MDQEEKQTPTSAKVVAVLFVAAVVVAGIAGLVVYGDPARRARRYASGIGEDGDNGALSWKIIGLGTDAALPAALDMLKSDDYITRKHGTIILRRLEDEDKVRAAMGDVLAAMEYEDLARNRSAACAMIAWVCKARPQYCGTMIPFLKDPNERVRRMAIGSIQNIANWENSAWTDKEWIQWWETEKHKYEEKPPADDGNAPPEAESDEGNEQSRQ